jgi:antitoxin (DNA-binding transcriptional repressor) of toxin-antitoxin stability system
MKAVGVKALKNELSRYLQLVRQGEVVLVLDRDEVVAELRRPSPTARPGADRWEVAVALLEAEGVLRPARGPGPRLADAIAGSAPVPDADRIIREARDERF